MASLQGKRVWITGASRGIGAALGQACSAAGAKCVLSARSEDALQEVAKACGGAEVFALDLMNEEALEATAKEVLDAGPVDVMIHNAGLTQRSLVKDTDMAVHRRIMQVNYFAPVALDRHVLGPMYERGRGSLVYVSSLTGHLATPLRSAYSASKHALQGYAESLRAECFDAGLRVTVVCPGFIKTGISTRALSGDGSEHGKLEAGQQRGLAPEKLAARVVRAIEREQDELLYGGREIAGAYLWRLAPGLTRRLIRKVDVT